MAQLRWTTPSYFEALRIPLERGRLFTDADIGKLAYIVNEAMARRFFPGQDPLGKQILTGVGGPAPRVSTIIGVVGDVRDLGLDVEPRPTLYSLAVSNRMALLIRGEVGPGIPDSAGSSRAAGRQSRSPSGYGNTARRSYPVFPGTAAVRAHAARLVCGTRGSSHRHRRLWSHQLFGQPSHR